MPPPSLEVEWGDDDVGGDYYRGGGFDEADDEVAAAALEEELRGLQEGDAGTLPPDGAEAVSEAEAGGGAVRHLPAPLSEVPGGGAGDAGSSAKCLASYGTVFTNAKAGMEGVDKEKVKRVVYEMSKVGRCKL